MTGLLAELKGLPFARQLELLETALAEGAAPERVLRTTAQLRDHEPFATLVRRLAGREALASAGDVLGELLGELPDAGIHRLLRGLERTSVPPAQLACVTGAVAQALRNLPLERLAVLCLMDRWLKNTAPAVRAAACAQARAACAQALEVDALDALADELILRVPGRELETLRARARELGHEHTWDARLATFVARVLDILGATPKGLSQANAEDILARRVYTDPGHFLVELLQNAEDAGARAWELTIGPREVSVWHDGVPFDARDVVGVLSIGQTTKEKEQIGFFGVGFKSVYEVCERPQVYSEPFRFEVADVSIPRPLAARPPGARPDGTLLVLPLRDPADPLRSPARLLAKALEVPGETLLTLSNLRRLGVAGAASARTIVQEAGAEPGRVRLRHTERDEQRDYLVVSERFRREDPEREASRASVTPVLVALALDARGTPVPAPAELPTVFSYLPTGERSGLRFLLHAHFDLPVDRERLDLSSAWNRWALGRVGELLGRAVARLVAEAEADPGDARRGERLDALLDVLPLDAELGHPSYAGVLETLRAAVQEEALLPGAAGERLAPARAAVLEDPELAEVLAGVDLDPRGRRPVRPLAARREAVAHALGARAFGAGDLLELLERSLSEQSEGAPAALPWLGEGCARILDSLARAGEALDLARLRALPLLPDAQGRLRRAAGLARASAELRAVYGDARVLLAEALDLEPTPAQAALWERLALPRLGPRDLLADLEDDATRTAILAARSEALWETLARLPARLTDGLGRLPLVADETGRRRPLLGPQAAWLAAPGALGVWARGLRGARPPLVDAGEQARWGAFFARLGGRTLDVPALLDLLGSRWVPDLAAARSLHAALETLRDELSPRLVARLAAAPLFPDAAGTLRPLRGDDAALVPADPDARRLFPAAPWLEEGLAARAHVLLLGVEPVGAARVARALLGTEPRLLDPDRDAALDAGVAYLLARPAGLTGELLDALADAHLWRDFGGTRHPLDPLRLEPEAPELRALYAAWEAFPTIEADGPASTRRLARLLRLEHRLLRPDFATLVGDLRAETPPPTRGPLIRALNAAAGELAPRQLQLLAEAPIFRARDQAELLPLAGWEDLAQPGCRRAAGDVRALLAGCGEALLDEADEAELAPLLAALARPPATVWDALGVLERSLHLAGEEQVETLLAGLVALQEALRQPPEPAASWRRRLEALPLWPTTCGRRLPAARVVRSEALVELLGEHAPALGGAGGMQGVLDPAARPSAEALAGALDFCDPLRFLQARVRAEARPGELLTSQPEFLSSRARLLELLELLRRPSLREPAGEDRPAEGPPDLAGLPLALDASQRLAPLGLTYATPAELELLAGVPWRDELADPAWAEAARALDPELAPRLPLRRVVAWVAELGPGPSPLAEHPRWADPVRRGRLQAWVLARGAELEADAAARSLLGRACWVPSGQGFLRAPQELLFAPDLPELGIDWNASEELAPELSAWLRRVYRAHEAHLDRLVGYLLAAHEEAAAARDGGRSARLLCQLARAFDAQGARARELQSLVKTHKVARRVRVETDAGRFLRPRKLLAPAPARWALIAAFARQPPERAAERYVDPGVLLLLRALGASADLTREELFGQLDPAVRREGPDAGLALARYLGARLNEEKGLLGALGERAFVPDGTGALRRPRELYWPEPDVEALVGPGPERYPHPAFAYALSPGTRKRLSFRRADDADPADVLGWLGRSGAADEPLLAWLEAALRAGRLRPAELHELLRGLPLFRDEGGGRRPCGELLGFAPAGLFARRRARWEHAGRFPRTARALGIPGELDAATIQAFLRELAADLGARSSQVLLDEEPELRESVPRCLAELGGLAAEPMRDGVLVALGHDAALELVPFADPRLAFADPPTLADAARAAGVALLMPLVLEEGQQATEAYLRACGLPDLRRRWLPGTLPDPLPHDVSAAHRPALGDLTATLAALEAARPRLRAGLGHLPPAAWGRRPLPSEVRVVAVLEHPGHLDEQPVSVPLSCALDLPRRRLVVIPEELSLPNELPFLLVRELLTPGTPDPQLSELVGELLEAEPAAFEQVLARHGVPEQVAEPAPPPAPAAAATPAAPAPEPDLQPQEEGLLSRVRRWFGGESAEDATPPAKPDPPASSQPTTQPPRSEPPPQPEPEPDADDEDGLLARMRRWLGQEEAKEPSPERPRPRRRPANRPEARPWTPPDHARWFRPRARIDSQLHDHSSNLADKQRPPAFGFAYAPERLPYPFLYAPEVVSARFEEGRQAWVAGLLREEWFAPAGPGEYRVVLRGRVPAGQAILPLPLYARLVEHSAGEDARFLRTPHGQQVLLLPEARSLQLVLALERAPTFAGASGDAPAPPVLLRRTVPDSELPPEVHAFLDALRAAERPPLARVQRVRAFVRGHYRYDPSYLEQPEVARWLRGISAGRANAHLAALHAGRDAKHLGRGVCYDLNVLVCELLRRLRVPAAIATGWTYDRGTISEPDHLWAMALLPSDVGPRWLPVDASTTDEGRPLHAARRPAGPWRVRPPRQTRRAPREPDWLEAEQSIRPRGTLPAHEVGPTPRRPQRKHRPTRELLKVVRHLARIAEQPLGEEAALRRRLETLLGNRERARALLAELELLERES